MQWSLNGTFRKDGTASNLDLINAKTKREGWVNVYPENEIGTLKKCKEDADADLFAKHRVACVHIEWEE